MFWDSSSPIHVTDRYAWHSTAQRHQHFRMAELKESARARARKSLSVSLSFSVSVCLCLSLCLSLSQPVSRVLSHTHTHILSHTFWNPSLSGESRVIIWQGANSPLPQCLVCACVLRSKSNISSNTQTCDSSCSLSSSFLPPPS